MTKEERYKVAAKGGENAVEEIQKSLGIGRCIQLTIF